jgi:hypothetical protein
MLPNQIANLAGNGSDQPQVGISDIRSVTDTIEEVGWLITGRSPTWRANCRCLD